MGDEGVMLKSDLVDCLVRRFPALTRKDVELSVAVILDEIQNRLVAGGRFEVRDFGVFSTHILPGRVGRNPRTGQAVYVASRRVVHFRPGKRLRAWGASQADALPGRADTSVSATALPTEVRRERFQQLADGHACGLP